MRRPTERDLFTKACRLSRKLGRDFGISYIASDREWIPSYYDSHTTSGIICGEPCHTKTAAITAIVADFIEIDKAERREGKQ